jgi:hypothetical protein
MANTENLISLADRTTDEKRAIGIKGGIASGKARREKKTMKETLKEMLEEVADIEGNTKGLTYRQLATLGLIKGSILGNSANYKTIMETIGELEGETQNTPAVKIEISDNSKLEGVMYEANRPDSNDDK